MRTVSDSAHGEQPELDDFDEFGRSTDEPVVDFDPFDEPAESPTSPERPGAVLIRLSDVEPQAVHWLWPGRIPVGKLTLLVGNPGVGKSFISLNIAARATKGSPWPDGAAGSEPGSVILLTAEDGLADTIRPRLDAAAADVSKVRAIETVRRIDPKTGESVLMQFCLERDVPNLEDAIQQVGDCRLVIIDPVSAYLGGKDSYKDAEVRSLLAPLSDVAARNQVAILAIAHLNKSTASPAVYRTMGSIAFVAAARSVWVVAKDKDDPTGSRRLVLPVKNNLGNDRTGLAYRLNRLHSNLAAHVEWEAKPVEVDADDALGFGAKPRGGGAVDEAVEWLMDILRDGPVPHGDIKKRAEQDGISMASIRRAMEKLEKDGRAEKRRDGFGHGGRWVWSLLGESRAAQPAAQMVSPDDLRTYGESAHLCVKPDENDPFDPTIDAQNPIGAQTLEDEHLCTDDPAANRAADITFAEGQRGEEWETI